MPSDSNAPIVQMHHVSKQFKNNSFALNDITLDVYKGDFVFLTGPSGAGKTTFLKLLFAAERLSSGQIIILGKNLSRINESNIHHLRRKIGIVFQDFKLIKNRTVFQNVDFVLRIFGYPRRKREQRTWQALKMVGMEKRLDAYPLELSGGEQQRIAIARALVNDPSLILADEPTGNLDPQKEEEIMGLFKQINLKGTTLIVATHTLSIINRMGEKAFHLKGGCLVEAQ